jgi:hypothetical protein
MDSHPAEIGMPVSHSTRQIPPLFLEKGLKRLFRSLTSVFGGWLLPPRDKIFAGISTFTVQNPFGGNFPAVIISARIIKRTLFAAAQIPPAARTFISPPNLA